MKAVLQPVCSHSNGRLLFLSQKWRICSKSVSGGSCIHLQITPDRNFTCKLYDDCSRAASLNATPWGIPLLSGENVGLNWGRT